MALPADVSTFSLTFGHSTNGYTDATGEVALVGMKVKLFPVDLVTGRRIVVTHVASGQVIVPTSVTFAIDETGKATVGPLPHTDNATLSPIGFGYRVEWGNITGRSRVAPKDGTFAVPAAAGATVDFDLLDVADAVPGVLVPMGVSGSVADPVVAALIDDTDSATRAALDLLTPTVTDATTGAKGVVQLAGDLGGTAAAPTVPGLATKVNSSTYTTGLAAKQDVATLGATVASNVTEGSALDAALRGAYGRFSRVVDLGSDGAANVSSIEDAFTAMLVAGKPTGRLTLRGTNAPIATALDFDLGYANVTAEANWADDAGHRFQLVVEGSLTPAAGIGTAITVRGGYGARVDVTLEGGGQASDIGVHVENLMRAEIAVEGANFAGTLLHADANGDTTKRLRQGRVTRLSAHTCGQALYWRGIEAFGKFDFVWDNNCVNGSELVDCADHAIGHWESFTTATQDYGLDFRNCNSFQVDVLTLGDRPTNALVRVQGGDFGRINQVRASGQPGIGTPLVTGLLLEEVSSIDIDTAQTFRCAKGVSVVGGGSNGIRLKMHRSMTTDINPLHITAGTGTAPRVQVHADYRFHQGASVLIGPGLTGGSLTLSGYLIDMHTVGGAAGKYAVDVDATSGAFVLDATGLEQINRAGMTGFTSHPTFANIRGVSAARIGNTVRHGADPVAAGVTAGSSWQNNTPRPAVVSLILRYNPDTTTNSGVTVRIGPNSASITNIGNSNEVAAATDIPITDKFLQVIVPPYWYLRPEVSGVGAGVQSSFVYYL